MRLITCLLAIILVATFDSIAHADNYPNKPIRLIVPFAPGGTDILARMITAGVSESFGQPVIIDNRPGAGGAIGAELTARAAADGYTLNMTTSSYAASAAYRKLPYDPVNGIEPVILVGTMGLVMVVHPALPVRTVKELIVYAQEQPSKLRYGSVGAGSINHLAIELFKIETRTSIQHIPYKGAGPALIAAVSGEIQLAPFGLVATLPHIKAGRLRAIGITTPQRSNAIPDIPSVSEAVPGFEVTHWAGIWAPKGTPREIVERWNSEVARALNTDTVKARMIADGLEPAGGSPDAFRQIIARDVAKWKRVVKEAKIEAVD